MRIARLLVERQVAACINLVPQIRSIYRWQGKVEDSTEWLLIIKTSQARFQSLREALAAAHSYEIPEILALPVVDGSPEYLSWLGASLEPVSTREPVSA